MDRPAVRQPPEGSGEERKMEETGCEINCGASTTPAVKKRGRASIVTVPSFRGPANLAYSQQTQTAYPPKFFVLSVKTEVEVLIN